MQSRFGKRFEPKAIAHYFEMVGSAIEFFAPLEFWCQEFYNKDAGDLLITYKKISSLLLVRFIIMEFSCTLLIGYIYSLKVEPFIKESVINCIWNHSSEAVF
jgi:hypothetical protein